MSDKDVKTLPPTASRWEVVAGKMGVLGTTIHDLEDLPSASKMGLSVILPLRVLWVAEAPDALRMSDLGVNEPHENLANSFFRGNEGFKRYLEDIRRYPNRPEGSSIPDLGCFTPARHYQLQVTPDDKEEESPGGPKTPENRLPTSEPLGMKQMRRNLPKDSSPGRSSSSGDPSPIESPLAGRGGDKSRHDHPLSHHSLSSKDSGDSSDKDEQHSLSSYSAAHSGAALTLYPQTEDEQIVNIALILFANAITLQCADAKAKWTPVRRAFRTELEKANFEARTDGFLCGRDNKSVEAIVEVKPRIRSKRQLDVQMQEAALMVSWIIADGLREPKGRPYLLVSQNRHEVYLTLADYDAGYIKYLKDETNDAEDAKGKDPETKSFLTMRSFGPWNIYRPSHMEKLAHVLLAFTIKVSQSPVA